MPIERSLPEIFKTFGDALKHDIRKVMPATVTAVNAAAQTVDVQIATNNLLFTDLGDAIEEDAASLSGVPLGCLRGGGFMIWLPVAVGDSVLLVFSDLSADTWLAGDGTPQAPGFMGVHTSDSPFAIPMFAPTAKTLASPAAEPGSLIIGKDGATAQIRLTAANIELGGPAGTPLTDFVALASKVDANTVLLQTVATALGAGALTVAAGFTASQSAAVVAACAAATSGIVPTGSTLVKSG
jgi:hypothetical protein